MLIAVEVIDLVLYFARVLERQEAVRKALRDEELLPVLRAEQHAEPLGEVRGAVTDVHRHVEDTAPGAAYELRLLERRGLVMQSANDSFPFRIGVVVLHELHVDAVRSCVTNGIAFEEPAAGVLEDLGFNDDQFRQRRWSYDDLTA